MEERILASRARESDRALERLHARSEALVLSKDDPRCHECCFHYITHDADWPYGCRAFEFKSKRLPSVVVRESSHEACAAFEERPARSGDLSRGEEPR